VDCTVEDATRARLTVCFGRVYNVAG